MNLRTVSALTARLLFLMGAFQLFPLALAVLDRSRPAIRAYTISAILCALSAYVLRVIGRGAPTTLHRKDAFGVVTLTWFTISILGAVPFVVEGSVTNPVSAIFEAVSGFTTGGGTVIANVDGLSRATNLWRCLMNWIGGMGIVVLFVAVFPQLGVGAKQLFRAEVPGPITEGLRPRIKQTALALWWIYTGLTLACVGLLVLFGMPLFDAICHAMSTLAAGGFSTKTASVNAFTGPGIDWTLCAFMLLAGLNFGLYYGAARGRWRDLFRNYELRFFLVVNLVLIAILFFSIRDHHPDPAEALRIASFQTTSILSTTGFMKEDYDLYPNIARYTLFLAMFMGGCAGSTAGGIKASRIYVLLVAALNELRLTIQPNAVIAVRVGTQALQREILYGVAMFVAAFFALFALASLCLVAVGLEPFSAMSLTVACLSSVGAGMGDAGPTESLEALHPFGKLVLILCMIAGRLEIFALFAVLHPETWRR